MAISNWVTLKEWKEAVRIGIKAKDTKTFADVLEAGFKDMKKRGHEFVGIEVDENTGRAKKVNFINSRKVAMLMVKVIEGTLTEEDLNV